jgi:hypothetical protein
MSTQSGNNLLPMKLNSVVLDCRDIAALSEFYIRLLGWEQSYCIEDQWMDISDPSGSAKISFQKNEDYVPPVWPEEAGRQQQMLHLDFAVQGKEQMELAVQHAIACGAKKAHTQYSDEWTVMIDPAGHPFCIVT